MNRKMLAAMLLLCALLTGCAAAPSEPTEAPATAAPTEQPASVSETASPTESKTEAVPTETSAPSKAPETSAHAEPSETQGLVESSAWKNYVNQNEVPEDALAVIFNAPFDREPDATVTWREGEYERAYVIPRYVGGSVNLFPVTWDETTYDPIVGDKAAESVTAEDGCVIDSVLERPEGMAMWYIEAASPDGRRAGMILFYNGDTGTPPVEYLTPGK